MTLSITKPLLLAALTLAPTTAPRVTFITQDVAPTGLVLATPIHTPSLALRPTNAVARQIRKGEALNCMVGAETRQAQVEYETAVVHTVVLDCDGARFEVAGILFERSEP